MAGWLVLNESSGSLLSSDLLQPCKHHDEKQPSCSQIMKSSFTLLLALLAVRYHVILSDSSFGIKRYHGLNRAANAGRGRPRLFGAANWQQEQECHDHAAGGTGRSITSRRLQIQDIRGGGTATTGRSWWIPSGYHPYGYQITALGEEFLSFPGSLECDLGRFLASLKTRKTTYALKNAWLEVIRNSKTAQAMNVYKNIDKMLQYCLKAKLID
jgi:hypothetical protein